MGDARLQNNKSLGLLGLMLSTKIKSIDYSESVARSVLRKVMMDPEEKNVSILHNYISDIFLHIEYCCHI